jgi:hypothetical protein
VQHPGSPESKPSDRRFCYSLCLHQPSVSATWSPGARGSLPQSRYSAWTTKNLVCAIIYKVLSFLSSVFLISYSLSAPYYFFHSGALAKLSRKIALLTLSLMSYPSVRLSTYRNFRTAKNVFMELDKNEYYQKFISKFQFCF